MWRVRRALCPLPDIRANEVSLTDEWSAVAASAHGFAESPPCLRTRVRNHVVQGATVVGAIVPVTAAIVSANVSSTGFWIAHRQCGLQVSDERSPGQMQQRVLMRVRTVRLRVNHPNGRKRGTLACRLTQTPSQLRKAANSSAGQGAPSHSPP